MRGLDVAWHLATVYAALVGWAFVVRYAIAPRRRRREGHGWRRPWWRSGTGVNLMAFSVSISVATTLLALDPWFGPFHRAVWLAVVVVIAAVMTHRLALAHRDSRRAD